MTKFRYRAYDLRGDLKVGETDAATVEAANESVWSLGLAPFDLHLSSSTDWLRPALGGNGKPIPAAALATFTREFATVVQAQIPLDGSLSILSRHGSIALVRSLASRLLSRVTDGAALSEALASLRPAFPDDYVNVIRAGELTSSLGKALTGLADMLERRVEIQARFRSALVYPAILLAAACISTTIVLGYLVPNITPIFIEAGKPLPSSLALIVSLEDNLVPIAGAVASALVVMYLFVRMVTARPEGKRRIHRVLLKLPIAGPLAAKSQVARFSRSLGTLVAAGTPLVSALAAATEVVANAHIRTQLREAVLAVQDGRGLANSLSAIASLPPTFVALVAIGEQANSIGETLLRAAGMFESQTQRDIQRLMNLLTPGLTIVIASIVGSLILTVMSAVLSINELAAQ
jgi:general secretion pathway protein F